MIQYRDATPADAAAIAATFERSFTDTFGHLYAPAELADFLATMTADGFRRELLDPGFAFRLATDDGAVAGYAKLGPAALPLDTPPASIELRQLYVLAPWQGAEVARALMDWTLAAARARSARFLQLSVYVDNHRARRFYQRYGFAEVGTYAFMVGRHADEDVVMRLAL